MSDDKLPDSFELSVLDERFRQDPYPVLADLRRRAPVHKTSQFRDHVFTRHADVRDILRDRDLLSDPRKANPGTGSREILARALRGHEPSMLLMDDPGHRRLRSLVSRSFAPPAVERWRPRVRAVVAETLDAIDEREFDLISRFADPVPTVVIAQMLGIDASRYAEFKRWSDLVVRISFNAFPTEEQVQEGIAANDSLDAFFAEQIESRRGEMGDDLISDMLRAEEEGERLTEQEIIRQCNLLLVAGNVTTTDLIGNGAKALLDHPDQLAKLRRNPDLMPAAVEEMLRYDSPVTDSGRIAHATVEFGGCPVHEGETLGTSLAAANRDPDEHPRPDDFDIEREDNHHVSFGGDRHMCLGAHLARVEAQEAFAGLLSRYPRLAHSDRGFRYDAIPSFRGLAEFWVQT